MQARWNLIARVISYLGTAATVIALVVSLTPSGQPLSAVHGALIAVAVVFFGSLVVLDAWSYRISRPRSYKSAAEINEYLYKWISQNGRATICTRNMSWADEERMKKVLIDKAANDDLVICLPERIAIAKELEDHGAQVFTYEELEYVPQSRFTIINQGRWDAHVAIGRGLKGRHLIEEFSAGQHPAFAAANDLVEVLKRVAQANRK